MNLGYHRGGGVALSQMTPPAKGGNGEIGKWQGLGLRKAWIPGLALVGPEVPGGIGQPT